MTRIDFHVWPDETRRQHEVRVCELVEQAWQAGHAVYVHCLNAGMAGDLDELLWTFHDTSFVPHALAGGDFDPEVRVWLGHDLRAPECVDTLINLHEEVPVFFSQFERVIETTGHDPETRERARARYRYYKDRGYPLQTRQA